MPRGIPRAVAAHARQDHNPSASAAAVVIVAQPIALAMARIRNENRGAFDELLEMRVLRPRVADRLIVHFSRPSPERSSLHSRVPRTLINFRGSGISQEISHF